MYESTPKTVPIDKKYWHKQLKDYLNPKMKNKSFLLPNRLEFKPLDKSELDKKPYVIAIDTETYAKNGNLICLCNSENNDVLLGKVDKQPSIIEYFKYLKSVAGKHKNVCFFAYNLKFDASILLKTLGVTIDRFYEEEFELNLKEEGLKIKYLNKKCLTLTKGNTTINIFDALQYFIGAGVGGSSSLDNVAKAYLGEQKDYKGKYQDKIFPDEIEYNELMQIIEYCFLDCKLTAKLMNIWIDSFYNNFGFYPNKFYSAGFVSVLVMKTGLNEFYPFRKTPFIVQDLAYKSYFGGRFEIMAKGFMENIYHYDIKSAYPYAMSLLPDLNRGRWFRIKSKEEFLKHARNKVGFYQIIVDVKEKKVAPFMFRDDGGAVSCPRGKFLTHTTGYELTKALDYYDFDLLKIEGFYFNKPDNEDKTEFNELIEGMYKTRMAQTNAGQKYVYKVIINSIYGKTAQSKPEPKGLFNPILCASITGLCRSMLLDVAKDNKNDIVMFATDGIFSKKPLPCKIGEQLGEYDYEKHPKFILLMAGIYSYNTEKNPELTPKSRGFSLRTFKTNQNGEKKSLQFDFNEYDIKEEEGNYFYEITNIRPLSIAKSVIEHKYSPDSIGKMIDVKKKIDLNGDNKRIWFKNINTIYDYSDSITVKLI
jgi:hypothetical protein